MCGIAGYHGLHADHGAPRAHERLPAAPRARRRRHRDRRPVRARPPSAVDHRRRARPAADGHRGRALLDRLQRRGLQLPRPARRAHGAGSHLRHRLRHRGRAAGVRAVGSRGVRPVQRHVRPGDLGPRRAAAHPGPRPLRHQAALRRPGREPGGDGEVLLFSSEIKPILASGLYDKKVNDRSVYRYLRFRAHEDGTETFFDGIERLAPGELLEVDANGIRRRMFTRLKEELLELASGPAPLRRRGGRGVQAPARRVGAAAAAVGGPGGHEPVGRPRLQRGRRHHQPAPQRGRRAVDPLGRHPPEHLLGRLPRLDQRRGAVRRRRPRHLHRPRRRAQDPADGRRVQGRPARLHPHPGGAAHLLGARTRSSR